MDKLSSAGYRSSTSSTSLTKLENILDDNCEGTKQVEEMLGPVRPVKTDYPSMLPKRKRTRMTNCTYKARTRASGAAIEDLMMQAKKIKYDIIGLTEMRRRHSLNAVYKTGEELFLGTCGSRDVGNQELTSENSQPSSCSREGVQRLTFVTELERNHHCIEKADCEIICDFYSDLFESHVHLPLHHQTVDGHFIPEVLPSEIRHAVMSAPGPDRIRPEHLKNIPPVLINILARLFTRYLSECKVPKQSKTSKTVLFNKKRDKHDTGYYRPNCLLSVTYKHFTKVILNRTEKALDEGQPC
ncbi:hypothetical protein RB195_017330 [Necator americanus]|uniref:Uncharacterized protein n=1 Tax=Necator americanus TaxID=51031 RepID=A0ABR1C4P9_NECAM